MIKIAIAIAPSKILMEKIVPVYSGRTGLKNLGEMGVRTPKKEQTAGLYLGKHQQEQQ